MWYGVGVAVVGVAKFGTILCHTPSMSHAHVHVHVHVHV